MGGISIWQLLILLAIVLLIFGTKRLRNAGGDLGGAIRSFKKGLNEDSEDKAQLDQQEADKADAQFSEEKDKQP